MNIPTINVISETDRDKAIHTTMLGFSTDPFLRWMYPNASSYFNAGPAFDAFGGGSIDHGSAFAANDFPSPGFACITYTTPAGSLYNPNSASMSGD